MILRDTHSAMGIPSMYRLRINCHDVFTISHPSEGTFRLEIHASPDEVDPDEARRLRAVLLGLAAELERDASPSDTDREGPGAGPGSRPRSGTNFG